MMAKKIPVDNIPFPELSESLLDTWNRVREVLMRELSDQSFKTWFDPVRFLSVDQQKITLGVPDNYFGKWLKDHYQDLIVSAFREITKTAYTIEYLALESEAKQPPPAHLTQKISPPYKTGSSITLNNKYTFDDFVVGPGNRFAHAAAVAISEAPARQFNPFFIHGSVGLGKTHLMQSIAHAIKQRFPESRILYLSSERFTNHLIRAIQTRSTQQFREKYRTLDLLLIDDIHFIAEKEATQEEFFHTFNALYDNHNQIVISSDRPPRDIPGLEERLVSRFSWGLVTDIQPPDFETRVAILKKKMEKETISVSDEVCYFIAQNFKSNVRELEGALIRVVAYCALTGAPLTLSVTQEILRDSVKEEKEKLSIDQIQRAVASYFHLKVSDLRAKRRTKSVAEPRQIAMFLIRQFTGHSLPEIGEYFGGRDHTTVLHACNKMTRAVEKDEKTQRIIQEITAALQSPV